MRGQFTGGCPRWGFLMIYLYSGTPGSGKTLHAVRDILAYDKKARPVIANFEINHCCIKNPDRVFYHNELKPDLLISYAADFWRCSGEPVKEESLLLVIDECQLVFNARDWNRNKAWVSFFTQHRKMGYKVILIAQSRDMIDKQIRAVLEFEYKHRKISNAGWFAVLCSWVVGSPFLYKKELASVRSVGKGANLGFKIAHYGRKCYRAYDTFKTW